MQHLPQGWRGWGKLVVELCTPIHISTHNTSSLHINTPGSANAQILIIIYSHSSNA